MSKVVYNKLSEEHKKKISDSNKGKKFSAEHIQRLSDSHKGKTTWIAGKTHSNESRDKIRKANIGKKHSEETKRKMSLAHKGKKKTAEHIKKVADANRGKKASEEARKNMSKAKIGKWRGCLASNWQGGKSFEEYSVNWTKTLKISIRERDKYVCQMCSEKQNDVTHHVHHIDYDKKNCNPDNLITLCVSCHMKTNYNRNYWLSFLMKLREVRK